MSVLSYLVTVLLSTVFGMLLLLGYLVKRMLSSDGWDRSNITNALRLLSHVAMHPQDFAHMFYVVRSAGGESLLVSRRAFPYLGKDELSDVVKTRPAYQERV